MPGLPRKDTKKRFNKLLKSSGKSKTNTMHGATATSKKISTYDPGYEGMVTKFKDFLNEKQLNQMEKYFEEIIRLFKVYKNLNKQEAKQITQEYNNLIIKEFEKGTDVKKTYRDLTYLVGDI